LEDLQALPPSAISETPFFEHIMSSLPSLHQEIKSAVTASEKNWLLDMRKVSAQVGGLALNQMEIRMKKWKSKQDRDPSLRHIRVGDPIELASNDKTECGYFLGFQISRCRRADILCLLWSQSIR
jgi:hypothetical protein